MAFDTLQIKAVEGLLSFKNENDLLPPPGGKLPYETDGDARWKF